MIKIIQHKAKYDFREVYDSLPRNIQPQFRHAVMASQGWTAPNTFYLAMRGELWLTKKQVNEIKAILKQLGQEIA
jgi:hypothetical protein